MLGATTNFGSQRCNASKGEALLITATVHLSHKEKFRPKHSQRQLREPLSLAGFRVVKAAGEPAAANLTEQP